MLMKKDGATALEALSRVSVDVAKDKFDACVRNGKSTAKAVFEMSGRGMDQFRRWLKKHGIERAYLWMEATGRYFEALAEWAVNLGWQVSIVNPRAIRAFATSRLKTSKTDPLDAEVILRFAETAADNEFPRWKPRTKALKELRDLQLEVAGLKKQIGQERNRLKCGLTSRFAIDIIRANLAFLQAQSKKLVKRSTQIIKADPELAPLYKSLSSVKGFGDVTIAFLIAKIDFSLFSRGRQLVKFAGLDTVHWNSGTSKKSKGISRVGHSDLRSALFLPAICAKRHDPDSRAFAQKLEARGRCKMEIICAVMCRLLRVAFAVVREGQKQPPV